MKECKYILVNNILYDIKTYNKLKESIMDEKQRLLKEAHELDKENEAKETTGERRLEIGKRLGEIQTRLGEIIPEQNAGKMYENKDEGR